MKCLSYNRKNIVQCSALPLYTCTLSCIRLISLLLFVCQLSSPQAWTTAAASAPSETASDSSIAAMVPISSLASCFYRFSAATSRYKPTRSIVPQVGTKNYSSVSKTVTLFLHTWINKHFVL